MVMSMDPLGDRRSRSGTVDDINPALPSLNYGNYGIFRIIGNAGFISSTVVAAAVIQTLPLWGLGA